METQALTKIAQKVRQTVESLLIDVGSIGPELINFPTLSCEVSTQILGLYLRTKGVENIVACRGKRSTPNSSGEQIHTWLLVNNRIIMDITSDQFPDSVDKVFVGEYSDFHSSFSHIAQRAISEEELHRSAGISYKAFYQFLENASCNTKFFKNFRLCSEFIQSWPWQSTKNGMSL